MAKLEEKDFIKGEKSDISGALLIREDCNGFIDSVLDQIYELDLTPEQQKELFIEVHKEKYDDSWKRVKFVFGPGNEIIFSRNVRKYRGEVTKTTHELTCNGQLGGDQMISILSGFGIIGSHRLFSYQESSEELSFNQRNELTIMLDDEANRTQYSRFGITKRPVFTSVSGEYTFKYLDRDSYKEEYHSVNGKGQSVYFDSEGNVLTQPEVIATTFGSFDSAYASFNEKLMGCRQLIDSRLKEITDKKTK